MSKLRSPTPRQILEARKKAGHTQQEAADIVHARDVRRWRDWESGESKMPPAAWDLYLIRTQAVVINDPLEGQR